MPVVPAVEIAYLHIREGLVGRRIRCARVDIADKFISLRDDVHALARRRCAEPRTAFGIGGLIVRLALDLDAELDGTRVDGKRAADLAFDRLMTVRLDGIRQLVVGAVERDVRDVDEIALADIRHRALTRDGARRKLERRIRLHVEAFREMTLEGVLEVEGYDDGFCPVIHLGAVSATLLAKEELDVVERDLSLRDGARDAADRDIHNLVRRLVRRLVGRLLDGYAAAEVVVVRKLLALFGIREPREAEHDRHRDTAGIRTLVSHAHDRELLAVKLRDGGDGHLGVPLARARVVSLAHREVVERDDDGVCDYREDGTRIDDVHTVQRVILRMVAAELELAKADPIAAAYRGDGVVLALILIILRDISQRDAVAVQDDGVVEGDARIGRRSVGFGAVIHLVRAVQRDAVAVEVDDLRVDDERARHISEHYLEVVRIREHRLGGIDAVISRIVISSASRRAVRIRAIDAAHVDLLTIQHAFFLDGDDIVKLFVDGAVLFLESFGRGERGVLPHRDDLLGDSQPGDGIAPLIHVFEDIIVRIKSSLKRRSERDLIISRVVREHVSRFVSLDIRRKTLEIILRNGVVLDV